MPATFKWICLALGGLVVLWYSLTRDIRYSREYMGDLRNRVVGARIIEDGGSPYFYKWRQGDTPRYYDPQAFDSYFPSICTSTPFLHRLLIPLADQPEARIMVVWMVIQYLLLALMTLYALRLAGQPEQKQAVLLVALLFLLTNGWKLHMHYGQTYLLIPALAMLAFALIRKTTRPSRDGRSGKSVRTGSGDGQGTSVYRAFAAGTAAACLVLVRPNTVLFFLPFIWLIARYPLNWKLAFTAPVVLLAGWVLLSPFESRLWRDYGSMVREQVKIHQALGAPVRPVETDPHFLHWEGLDMDRADSVRAGDPVHIYSENGNVFVLYQKLSGRKISLTTLGIAGIAVIGSLMGLFLSRRRRSGSVDPVRVAIFGFCLYMVSDLFSPVYRHQYYTVQWLMPLLLAATLCPSLWRPAKGQRAANVQRAAYGLLLAGLLLNIIHFPFIKMGNSIGEYGILLALLAISLYPGRGKPAKAAPARLP